MAEITEEPERFLIETSLFKAAVRKTGYVSGVEAGSFVDRQTGSRDPGFGLLIADFLLQPGASPPDAPAELRYSTGDLFHGNLAKRYVSLPQICTQAKSLKQSVVKGNDFVGVRQSYVWNIACPGFKAGSEWEQHLLFPEGKRWFVGWDRFRCPEAVTLVQMRMDMPGHIRHKGGDVFRQIYLSYLPDPLPQHAFHTDFPPDARYLYQRKEGKTPRRFIRAVQLENGTWLAGMALEPSVVAEAWCHQRGYVCMIEEFDGRAVRANEWTGAVHLVGYFDSLAQMHEVYDQHAGAASIRMDASGWSLSKRS